MFWLDSEWIVAGGTGASLVEQNGWHSSGSDEISEEQAPEFIPKGSGRYGRIQRTRLA
jgi:hypothetical protein